MKFDLCIKDEKTMQLLSDIREKAKELTGENLVKIILYGSYARDRQDNYSDMDMMILVDDIEEDIKGIVNKFITFLFPS
jgi:predicted nucleotidyltransferase